MSTATGWKPKLVLFVLGGLVVIGFVFLGVLPPKADRILLNHMRAINNIHSLVDAEKMYATAHPESGFTCDLKTLRGTASQQFIDAVLASGQKSGYSFGLGGCDASGQATHFNATATPVNEQLGHWSFCTNEAGVLWFSADGSKANCLASRKEWSKERDGYK